MERFVCFSISILVLVVTVMADVRIAEAQAPPTIVDYCVIEGSPAASPLSHYVYQFVMTSSGDIYVRWHFPGQSVFGESLVLIGNLWQCTSKPSSEILHYDAQIEMNADQSIFVYHYAMMDNGDVYMNRTSIDRTTRNEFVFDYPCCYLMGNYWQGTVSTDKDTWAI